MDLGHEPPLSVDGSEAAVIDRRRVSVQWFSGTILTGLCGAALIGGAVFASLDGETTFARMPERVESALRGAFGANDRAVSLHKADRLPPPGEQTASRNVMRVSTVTRVGNRDVMRVRPFTRISGNLSMTTSDLSAKIPPFNAQRMLSDTGSGAQAASDDPDNAAEPDAEVSFVTKDLASVLPKAKISAVVALDEIVMRVRDAANWRGNGGSVRYALANAAADVGGAQSDLKMAYANEGASSDPYAGFETRVVPENVTLLPKTKDQITGGNPTGERIHLVKKGDTVTSILRDQGATPDEAKAIAATLGVRGRDGGLKEGEKLRILMAPASAAPGARLQPYRVIVANETTVEAVAALSDLGKYVAVDVSSINTVTETADKQTSDDDDDDDGSGVRLYQSIYETALRNKVPTPVIDDMIRVYSYDVDFQRKVQPGDSFEVLYSDDENAEGKSEVRYASLTVGGEMKKYYHYQTADDGNYDYYDESGKSAKKFLVRKPVAVGMVTSGFGWRNHPMLHVSELHSGVDWAAPMGTPIFAAGNGTIEEIGLKGGYGKYVKLRHSNGYETAYGHMTAFARGLDVGSKVRQGQIIGFVGSTGLSTGSHVHFEILINDRFVDPMKVKLPRGRVLDGGALAQFEKDREQLDAVMTRAPARVAQAR